MAMMAYRMRKDPPRLGRSDIRPRFIWEFLIVLVAFGAYVLFVNSRIGLVVRRRTNEERLEAFGYNSLAYRLAAYLFSGALSTLAGALFAIYAGFVSPDLFGVATSAKVLLMVSIGSAGTLLGPALGALHRGVEEILSGWTERWLSLLGLVYILVAVVAFAGIRFGAKPAATSQAAASDRACRRSSTPAVLKVEGLRKNFGAISVIDGIDLEMSASRRHLILGANGAGKTTFFNLLTGQLSPSAGRIEFCNEEITTLPARQRARRGLGRTFQIASLFPDLSILDNLRLAANAPGCESGRAKRTQF